MPPRPEAVGLADAFRARTESLHRQAERTGIVGDLLRGRIDRFGYALYLRNLLPAYDALERGLERHRQDPPMRAIASPMLYRAPALESDLDRLYGTCWADALPIIEPARRYAGRIDDLAAGDGTRLIAHAYTRYLGDLNGGQVLSGILRRALALGSDDLSFHRFPGIDDLARFRADYRAAIDAAGEYVADPSGLIEEAAHAFRYNIDISIAVRRRVGARP